MSTKCLGCFLHRALQLIKQNALFVLLISLMTSSTMHLSSQVKLESEYKVTDDGLFFDGTKVANGTPDNNTAKYDFFFGSQISAHGDAIKVYKHFVFTTWYRGDKYDRHVMLSRYNTQTGVVKTIEFPHRHTGYQNQWWIGESHNTIAVGIAPNDETIHMLYDMHSYSNSGAFVNDYFRYSYSQKNAATVPDDDFKIELFVNSARGDYKHVGLNGVADAAQFSDLTYPRFFTNVDGDLLMHMRKGGNTDGAYVFSKYDAGTSKWDNLTQFNRLGARNFGQPFNWGLYGNMKYVNGKLRVGFQVRSANSSDKYLYQNGIYYAYSDDQSGKSQWKDHLGNGFSIPFANPDIIKVYEPGDLVAATGKDEVYIVGGFDWTVTDRGDVHIISQVRDTKNNVTKNVHTYKPAGSTEFITTTSFAGGTQIYTYANNIYLIDLKNNRPFIQKAEGGTNNFQTVYQATSGRTFRHGVPRIENGKLYYYMQENKSGTKVPLYVQVIDLNIDITPRPVVSITEPKAASSYLPGTSITISADASYTEGNITKVVFRVNGEDYQEVNAAPYSVSWTPTETGIYTIDAVAYASDNSNAVSGSINVAVYTENQTSLNLNFEDEMSLTNWQLEAGVATASIVDSPISAQGSKVFKVTEFNANTGFHYKNESIGKVVAKPGDYVHSIIYASSLMDGGQATASFSSSWASVTPGFQNLSTTEMSRLTFKRQYPATETSNMIVYPRLRLKPGADLNNSLYFDNLVMYVHASDATDLVAPMAATNFVFESQTELSNGFSWTEGVDALTGVQQSYILRTTNSQANAPVLLPQVAYSVSAGANGPSMVGDWSVIGVVDAGITNFIDETIVEDEVYYYAVVHRDLAYNYSNALMSTNYSTGLHRLKDTNTVNVYPNPSNGTFNIDVMNIRNANIVIYNMTAKVVYRQQASNQLVQITLGNEFIPGLYLVKVTDEAQNIYTQKVQIR